MNTPDCFATDFGLDHFGTANLGDKRRTDRLVRAANRIVQRPDETLPHKLLTPADLDAFYRLVNRPEVTHAAVLAPHRERTRQRMLQQQGTVLILHDATELDYTTITSLKTLGQIGNGSKRGYICQNSLAVAADSAEVLGLASQILHHRRHKSKGETTSKSRRRADRESRLWVQGAQAVGPAPEGAHWVHVADRGSDTFEALENFHRLGRFVVRANTSRVCARSHDPAVPADTFLHDYARSLPSLGGKPVDVSFRPADRKGRTRRPVQLQRKTNVCVAAGPVRLQPPHVHRGEHGNDPLPLWIVHLHEETPPAQGDPLEWFLLTNQPVTTLEQALEVARWYELRWIIEELHKAMKTGCRIEKLQFTTEAALQPTIALLSVVATFLLNLRELARRPDAKERPARQVVCPLMVKVLCLWRHEREQPDWSLHAFVMALARLGGHQNRKHDGHPGWLTLWRGWQGLQAMLLGYRVKSRRLQCA
jgi:hypothetical protein